MTVKRASSGGSCYNPSTRILLLGTREEGIVRLKLTTLRRDADAGGIDGFR